MTTREDSSTNQQARRDHVPENPEARPAEAVDALDGEGPAAETTETGLAAEDVTENPDADELEGLPGPSSDEPGESAG